MDGCVGGVPMRIVAAVDTPQEGVPSPDSPVAIVGRESISGRVCAGNNLAPRPVSRSLNGLTYTVNADGTFTINGTPEVNSNNRIALPAPLPPGTYTLSINNPVVLGTGGNNGIAVQLFDDGNAAIAGTIVATNTVNSKATFTTTVPALAINIRVPVAAGALTNFAMAIQVEAGTTATPYAPHRAYPITYTPPKPMYGMDGARDTWEPTVGRLTQLTDEYSFTGDEAGWMLFSPANGVYQYYIGIAGAGHITDVTKPMSNYFDSAFASDRTIKDNICFTINQPAGLGFICNAITSLDDWRDFLRAKVAGGNAVSGIYPASTPIVTYFDPIDTPSYPGTNTVYTDAGGDVTITGHQTAQYTAEQQAERADEQDRRIAVLEAALLNG